MSKKPSAAAVQRLVDRQAVRNGTAGKLKTLSPAHAQVLRDEILAGKDGPHFGSGPAKREMLLRLIVADPGRDATTLRDLYDPAHEHWRLAHPDDTTMPEAIRERIP
jgi:hypothetical protein